MSYLRKTTWARKAGLVLLDALLICAATYIALTLRYDTAFNKEFANTLSHIAEIVCVYLVLFAIGGVYDILWRYAGVNESIRLTLLSLAAGAVTLAANYAFLWSISRPVLGMLPMLAVALTGGARMGWRVLRSTRRNTSGQSGRTSPGPRLMIVGAGMAASYVVQMCKNDPGLGQPILLVDDDPQKQRLRVQGVVVRGKTADIPELAARYDVQEIIIAIPSLRGEPLNALIRICKETNCRVRISTQIQSPDRQTAVFVRELNISDFLSRDEIKLDQREIAEYLAGKVVLVTGGGGSIGSELCRQIMRFSPKLLILFDIYENCLYDLECELRQKYGRNCAILALVGSVRDRRRLDEVMDEHRPSVVFHAAAHKHVPLMEDSPAEAVKNNVFGTLNVLESAAAYGAERFVLLSTDKAVNPTNVMGATKRITEMLIQYFAGKTGMKCMAVRFGNVLGSHGSVIPLFEKQIKAGGPVTVTHPDIIRYFMTIPEAAQLVLQAGSIAKSGSIFVLDMGEPVRIDDLARQLIRFYGYEPNVQIGITYTGLRPGEKLYEELLTVEERAEMERTVHDKIMIAPPIEQDVAAFEGQLVALGLAAKNNDTRVVDLIQRMVPTFTPDRAHRTPQPAAEPALSKAE